ncbi:hypothetical protein BGZ83_006498 [Gryganskiella cystojenkinii]|nr:hypothetical protein BGZ83_006498 [Gryganskiella cystojenkinii]
MTKPHRALEIEEIRRSIAEYLRLKDILTCTYVNRDWHTSFFPFIWQIVDLSIRKTHWGYGLNPNLPSLQSLEENQHWVQSLIFKNFLLIPFLTLRGFHQLTFLSLIGDVPSVKFNAQEQEQCQQQKQVYGKGRVLVPWPGKEEEPDRHSPWYYWRSFLQHHQSVLRSLSVAPSFDASMTVQFLEAIQGCGKLQSLKLEYCKILPKNAALFWKACAHVKKLEWQGGEGTVPHWNQPSPSSGDNPSYSSAMLSSTLSSLKDIATTTVTPPDWKLRTLVIRDGHQETTDIAMFQHCKDLRQIRWSSSYVQNAFPMMFFGDELWPQLEQVDIRMNCSSLTDAEWTQMISSSMGRRLVNFTVEEYQIERMAIQLIFETEATPGESRPGLPITIPESKTYLSMNWNLTSVDLKPCTELSSSVIQSMLSTLPALEYLHVHRIEYMDIIEGDEWVCKNLRELHVDIDMTILPQYRSQLQNPDIFYANQRLIFKRLSALNKLEKLFLHQVPNDQVLHKHSSQFSRNLDLRLAAGLDALVTLTNLSELVFENTHQRMTLPDIEWMVQSWSGLSRVQGALCHTPIEYYQLKRCLNGHGVKVFDPFYSS